ncbi:MAG: radical SAM protein [Candidatus Shapirobacteria bacterium]|nr:radical SAM protein [Candidatus Shapirobacteria bacterium]
MNKFERLRLFLSSIQEPSYRFDQIIGSIFLKKEADFESMFFLSKELRSKLKQEFTPFLAVSRVGEKVSSQGEKVLFSLFDSEKIESVKMIYRDWQSFCLSSQVGCLTNCLFCATGKMGFKRNLTTDEIVDQLLYFHLKGEEIDTISFMGMGEPLANPNFFEALGVLTASQFFNISQRKINISTVGFLPTLKQLINDFPSINVALSLNNPFPQERQRLMPIEKRFPLKKVLPILTYHARKNRRKIFLAYILFSGVNDAPRHIQGLSGLIRDQGEAAYLYHVNLIDYHPVAGCSLTASGRKKMTWFKSQLEKQGIKTTIRRSLGLSFQGACGQLRT